MQHKIATSDINATQDSDSDIRINSKVAITTSFTLGNKEYGAGIEAFDIYINSALALPFIKGQRDFNLLVLHSIAQFTLASNTSILSGLLH